MNGLPVPGSQEWNAWRKSGVPIDAWMAAHQPEPARQSIHEANMASEDQDVIRTQPEPTSTAALQTVEISTLPQPVNPAAVQGEPGRSFPSGGLAPTQGQPLEHRFYRIEEGSHGRRNARRIRKDTDTEAGWTQEPEERDP